MRSTEPVMPLPAMSADALATTVPCSAGAC